ncbi:hypothetical protein [Candidatus Phycosocius spiralis]|uniref:Lipoprotein n=1 Tax=Candidatus Phycosocius spiralis TaxID=2815099 RepID=A0ABQ4PT29_9PROT|nr:hypothetical protein [Candidatus Phycosocius spiralis]GIU66128.1 hypothetical protein PsB1_0282 [Candidatus Phycosocius spiralis]
MKYIGLLVIVALVSGCQAIGNAPACGLSHPRADELLSLSFEQFDQDFQGGWRAVAEQEGCEASAAELIGAYVHKNREKVPTGRLSTLKWHQGQLLAASGKNREAIKAFKATKPQGDDAQNYYADATIAFLRRDRAAFDQARAGLAALPPPKNWEKAAADFEKRFNRPRPVWPMNLDVVDRLGTCFDQPYSKAYAGHCANGAPPHTPPTAHKP